MTRKHIIFYKILRPLVIVFTKIKFGYKYQTARNLPDNYIVLSNHVTDFDPLFVGASFPKQMYFVASEHIARWGLASTLLNFVFAPIMRNKGTVAASTVMEVLRKVKKGANVCIFAEGVRTWDGVTCPILPSTAKLIQAAKCGLVTYKIVGGYFVSPNWSKSGNTRRGYISGAPVGVYTKEQLASMSQKEIYEIITRDLYEDAYERQLAAPKKYSGKRLAEHLENLLFICPNCGKQDTFRSFDDTVTCETCGLKFTYDAYSMLAGVPYQTIRDFSNWQKRRVAEDAANGIAYTAATATLSTITEHVETLVAEGELTLSADALRCGDTEIPLQNISDLAIHGRHSLVFAANKHYYEVNIPQSNALKFVLFFEALKNNEN